MLFQKNMAPGENNSSQNLELQVIKAQVCSEPARVQPLHLGLVPTEESYLSPKAQHWN